MAFALGTILREIEAIIGLSICSPDCNGKLTWQSLRRLGRGSMNFPGEHIPLEQPVELSLQTTDYPIRFLDGNHCQYFDPGTHGNCGVGFRQKDHDDADDSAVNGNPYGGGCWKYPHLILGLGNGTSELVATGFSGRPSFWERMSIDQHRYPIHPRYWYWMKKMCKPCADV